MTETKHGKEHDTSEFLPNKLEYKVLRNDKTSDCRAVLIAVKKCIMTQLFKLVQWVEVNVNNQIKCILVASTSN